MIKEITIYEYRTKQYKKEIDIIEFTDRNGVIDILKSFDLVEKQFGLCAEPYDKYFEIGFIDDRGVSHGYINKFNVIHATLNRYHCTCKKIRYYYGLDITQTNENYHIVAMAQSPSRYRNIKGLESMVYMCEFNELEQTIKMILKDTDHVYLTDEIIDKLLIGNYDK